MKPKPGKSFLRKLGLATGFAALGFAAVAIPLHLYLRKEMADAPEDLQAQGWPIRLMQVLFAKHVLRWIDVEGLENLPQGSYVIAANHAYKSGVDGFILGHLLATRAGRVPRIVITIDNRNWVVRAERWVLHHYGIALLVGDPIPGKRHGASDTIAAYLGPGDAECYVGCGNRIGGRDDYCGITAQQRCDLPPGVFPCYWTSAGDTRVQGEPS